MAVAKLPDATPLQTGYIMPDRIQRPSFTDDKGNHDVNLLQRKTHVEWTSNVICRRSQLYSSPRASAGCFLPPLVRAREHTARSVCLPLSVAKCRKLNAIGESDGLLRPLCLDSCHSAVGRLRQIRGRHPNGFLGLSLNDKTTVLIGYHDYLEKNHKDIIVIRQ